MEGLQTWSSILGGAGMWFETGRFLYVALAVLDFAKDQVGLKLPKIYLCICFYNILYIIKHIFQEPIDKC